MKKKVIIDTDPGIDDAMAIVFAHASPVLEIVGLTTTYGNVSVDQATENALILTQMLESAIPVCRGSDRPLQKKLRDYPAYVHGKNGFGDIELNPAATPLSTREADEFIIETVKAYPGEITLIPIGPLTNLAKAIQKAPEMIFLVKEVIIMGGAVTVNGNVNPAAEANMFSDPLAADRVLTSGLPVTLVGLDVTHKIIMEEAYLRRIHSPTSVAGDIMMDMIRFYLDFHISTGVEGLYTHDPAAIAYAVRPELFETRTGATRVVTSGAAEGRTIMNLTGRPYGGKGWEDVPEINACLDVDIKAVLTLYEETIAGFSSLTQPD